ncbi:hypothetical protein CRG98_018647 [Punica granatum]|uniref:Uncharacterized protein n=1 Tax=Punica granatum TaxID=22663 RepID=A0A2I0JXB6_PUNGR|nr:hypothetical protein CRG98_018647 [Punica granatum]
MDTSKQRDHRARMWASTRRNFGPHRDQTGVLLKVFGYILYTSTQPKMGNLLPSHFGPPALKGTSTGYPTILDCPDKAQVTIRNRVTRVNQTALGHDDREDPKFPTKTTFLARLPRHLLNRPIKDTRGQM